MKNYWIIALCLGGLMLAGAAHADEVQEYNDGYNAGSAGVGAPDSNSSLDYSTGWNEGAAAAYRANNPEPPPSDDQSSSDNQQ